MTTKLTAMTWEEFANKVNSIVDNASEPIGYADDYAAPDAYNEVSTYKDLKYLKRKYRALAEACEVQKLMSLLMTLSVDELYYLAPMEVRTNYPKHLLFRKLHNNEHYIRLFAMEPRAFSWLFNCFVDDNGPESFWEGI